MPFPITSNNLSVSFADSSLKVSIAYAKLQGSHYFFIFNQTHDFRLLNQSQPISKIENPVKHLAALFLSFTSNLTISGYQTADHQSLKLNSRACEYALQTKKAVDQ